MLLHRQRMRQCSSVCGSLKTSDEKLIPLAPFIDAVVERDVSSYPCFAPGTHI